jgi:hypothetical protein
MQKATVDIFTDMRTLNLKLIPYLLTDACRCTNEINIFVFLKLALNFPQFLWQVSLVQIYAGVVLKNMINSSLVPFISLFMIIV